MKRAENGKTGDQKERRKGGGVEADFLRFMVAVLVLVLILV